MTTRNGHPAALTCRIHHSVSTQNGNTPIAHQRAVLSGESAGLAAARKRGTGAAKTHTHHPTGSKASHMSRLCANPANSGQRQARGLGGIGVAWVDDIAGLDMGVERGVAGRQGLGRLHGACGPVWVRGGLLPGVVDDPGDLGAELRTVDHAVYKARLLQEL